MSSNPTVVDDMLFILVLLFLRNKWFEYDDVTLRTSIGKRSLALSLSKNGDNLLCIIANKTRGWMKLGGERITNSWQIQHDANTKGSWLQHLHKQPYFLLNQCYINEDITWLFCAGIFLCRYSSGPSLQDRGLCLLQEAQPAELRKQLPHLQRSSLMMAWKRRPRQGSASPKIFWWRKT